MAGLTAAVALAFAAGAAADILRTLAANGGYTGRHRPETVDPVPLDWRPPTAAERLALRLDTMPLPRIPAHDQLPMRVVDPPPALIPRQRAVEPC